MTTICNATYIYYTVANAPIAPTDALWSGIHPRHASSLGWASTVGESWHTSPATQATAMDATPETTPPNGQPAVKKSRQKKRTRKEIKAGYITDYDDAFTHLDKKLSGINRLHRDKCCSILLVAFGKYHPPSASAKDMKKELNKKVVDNLTWRQRDKLTRPVLTTETETT